MSSAGTCKSWRGDKGFGFITAEDGSEVFMHVQACTDGGVPQPGDILTYDVEESQIKPGQMQAKNVTGGTGTAGDKGSGKGSGPPGSMSGSVKSFNGEKGFGFLIGPEGDVFCHLNAVVDGSLPQMGDVLTFDVEDSKSKPGQKTACNVRGGSSWNKGGKGGKDSGKGWDKGGYGAYKGDSWGGKGGPYGGGKDKGWGKSMDKGWGKDAGWGGDSWGGKGGDSWGGKGGGWGGDSWGGDGGKGKGWGGDSWGGAKGGGKDKGWGGCKGGW